MIKKFISRSYSKLFFSKKEDSFLVSKKIIAKHTAKPDFPYLVSFSRTGSHWLRNIMELYFEKPAMVRIFYYKNATDFTCYHSHDMMLDVIRKNVIYLYRHPIDTVYSQLRYHKQDINNQYAINYWASLYGQHLSKWLLEENFTEKKTVITYENMKKDLSQEFIKVCEHLGYGFDKEKLAKVADEASKENIKKKTTHDPQVINLSNDYDEERKNFHSKFKTLIMENIYKQNSELKQFFKEND